MVFSLDFRAHSEVGLVRKNNQDSGYASPTMLMVADGMGGAAAGDLASTVAIREILRSDGHHDLDTAPEVLAGALARANHLLADLVGADPSLDGMGTTVCGALFTGNDLALVHIGDSRGYLLRGGVLHRLTHDHSWVQSLVDEGKISLEEAAVHPHRSLLLKVLNGQPTHEPDLETVELELDDRLLFCSDGLCGFVPDATIRHVIANTPNLDQAMDKLVAAAHAGGGADNITILLADVLPNSERLAAKEPSLVGAAVDGIIPETAEHTLHGLDPVAVAAAAPLRLETAPEPAATGERVVESPEQLRRLDGDEAGRYEPTEHRRRPLLTALAVTTALAVLAAGGLWGVWRYGRTQYFVGAQDAQVAVFQGFPGSALGRPLHTVVERPGIAVADLPTFFQQQVNNTIPVASLAAAETTVGQLRTRALACIARRGHSAGTSTPEASATPVATPGLPTAVRPTDLTASASTAPLPTRPASPAAATSSRPASPPVASSPVPTAASASPVDQTSDEEC